MSSTISELPELRNFTGLKNTWIPVKRTNDRITRRISIFDLMALAKTVESSDGSVIVTDNTGSYDLSITASIILNLLGLTEDDLEKLKELLSKEPDNGWEISYVKPDNISVNTRFVIPLTEFENRTPDKAEFFTEQKMYFGNPSLIEMWACQPRDGVRTEWDESTATKVPFDGFNAPLVGGNSISQWGLYEDGQSIWINFANAAYPIPIKIIKKKLT